MSTTGAIVLVAIAVVCAIGFAWCLCRAAANGDAINARDSQTVIDQLRRGPR